MIVIVVIECGRIMMTMFVLSLFFFFFFFLFFFFFFSHSVIFSLLSSSFIVAVVVVIVDGVVAVVMFGALYRSCEPASASTPELFQVFQVKLFLQDTSVGKQTDSTVHLS